MATDTVKVTLLSNAWNNNSQTLVNSFYSTGQYVFEIFPDNMQVYMDCGITADQITTEGRLTFHCKKVPKEHIQLRITKKPAEYKEYDTHTLLLLHGDSIKDSSIYNIPLVNKGVITSTDQSKFGGKSLYFNGNNAGITFPQDFIIYGNKDFTFDWWEYARDNTRGCRFTSSSFDHSTATTKRGMMVGNDGKGFRMSIDGANFIVDAQNMFNLTLNQWVHWAIVRTNGKVTTYRNGQRFGEINVPSNYIVFQDTSNPQAIGQQRADISQLSFKGYIDEFRISDVARWTSNFVPPTKPYE